MPITFSITLDVDEELARFFENLQTGQPSAVTATKPAKKARSVASPAAPKPAKKATKVAAAKPAKKAAKAAAKPVTKATTKPVAKAVKKAGPGRKPSLLSPAIGKAVEDLAKKGSPFRASDVVRQVMKKNPTFNEGSVTTGVSNHLKTTTLKSEQVKDAVGRPYRLYKG